ncbi:hypothetical protein EDC94DRAFT_92588 [Helicostylum pulchrum]|nr:hypothetical protein EDC94DRAFT_92588 [Helicostylum pulchrum]
MFQHNRQQKSSASNSDHGMLNISPQPTSFSASTKPSLSYDTPTRQSSETDMQPKKTSQTNLTTISSADYALNVMFSQFEQMADGKMSFILNLGVDADVDLRKLLGQGNDEAFDQLIYSLSSLAATQQSAVIDAVMRWRKVKVEPLDPSLIKRVSDSAPLSRSREIQSVLKERQSVCI